MESKVVQVWEFDEYRVRIEFFKGEYYIHCDVYNEALSAIKACKAFILNTCLPWASTVTDVLFCYTPNPKFVKLVLKGAEHIGSHPKYGIEVFAWELR